MSAPNANAPIHFPDWKAALGRTPLAPAVRARHHRAIITFLKFCKERHAPASVAVIRIHLAGQPDPEAREALLWFYQAAQTGARAAGETLNAQHSTFNARADAGTRATGLGALEKNTAGRDARRYGSDEVSAGQAIRSTSDRPAGALPMRARGNIPPPAAVDQGGADWERDLVRAAREAGLLWRSEETYRLWAARFARFLAPRSPYAATAADVGAFLSELAVAHRAMPSTQKQAFRVNGFANAADFAEVSNDALRLRALFRNRSRSLYRI